MVRWALMLCCLLAAGCAAEREPGELFGPSEAGTLVVDALLIVDHPLPDLFVRQTVAPGVRYTDAVSAVTDAHVEVRQGAQVFRYRTDPDSLGRYLPPERPPPVMPNTAYALTVRSEGREARATTRTPGRFQIREVVLLDEETLEVRQRLRTFIDGADQVFTAPENQVVYRDGRLEIRFQPIDVPGYQVGIISLDRNSERVLEDDFLEEEDYEERERQASSPAFVAPDGKLPMPWFVVSFAGRHMIRVYALDKNWFDFARSSPEYQDGGFGGLAGDNFERPLFHVAGGIGLFGSASVDSLGFVLVPRE